VHLFESQLKRIERKEKNMKTRNIKKKLVGASVMLALAGGGVLATNYFLPVEDIVAYALTLPSGNTEIGKINNVPVIKANTNNIASPAFQQLVDSIIADSNARYVVNKAYWSPNTALVGGNPLSNMSIGQSYWIKDDGFTNTDKYVQLRKNEVARISNIGYATDMETGNNINLDLGVIYQNSQTSNGSGTADTIYMAAKSQSGVITLGWLAPADAGSNETGGESENGGSGSGGGGAMASYVNSVEFTLVLVNADTGQPLDNDQTLMALKLSDIDALQRATLDSVNAKGIILSPDTELSIDGQGMVANSTRAQNNDSTLLSPLSYITLRQFNAASTQYAYTGNEVDKHCDIVVGAFGEYPFTIDLKGKVAIDKSTVQYGKNEWNNLYSFIPLQFEVIDKNGKVVDTVTLDKDGKATSKDIPKGEYTLREKATNWSQSGQTKHEDIKVTVEAGKTKTVKVDNTAVTGKITIHKTGVESGEEVWNSNYTLEGNKFKLTSKTDKKTYEVTTDKTGTAVAENLPLGEYEIEEIAASNGFVNTFEKKAVTLSYKDQNTAVVFGETAGTNQEVKGENTLQKVDKETELEQNGKAVLKTAKYQLFYDDESTGSSPHKPGDPVKWTDKPTPELKAGEKVKEAVIGGTKVTYGDEVVIDVDDDSLQAAVGNLAAGDYYWLEVDSGEGYVTDPTKHTFSIQKVDDQTATIITEEGRSEEQAIKARVTLDKSVTLPDNQGGSGFNGIEFTASPLEGTKAEPVVFKTGVHPVTGDDGYASQELVYGDWKIEETKGVEGYDDVRPIYIHMETDEAKDILTISASYKEDFSQPFSLRRFSIKDSSNEPNPNAEEAATVGEVTSAIPVISLSTIRFNDNPNAPVEPENPNHPNKDVTKVDGGESINNGNVALASDFVYVLNSSVLKTDRKELNKWEIDDNYDETYDQFDGTFALYATTDFDKYKKGDKLPTEFVKSEDKDGHVVFTAQQPFLDVLNKEKDKEIGFSIHADFYRFKASDEVLNVFDETINDQTEKSNEVNTKTPSPAPHKFDLSTEQFDLTGNKLLDDDKEMKDRYEDSNKDPYTDKTDNNEKENINTAEVKPGDTLHYQLWLDTTPFDETSELTTLGMTDDYDEKTVIPNLEAIHVYNKEGKEVTDLFKIEDKEGTLTISANVFKEAVNSKGEKVQVIDTEKLPFNQVYKIELPMTVKEDVKPGTEIVNTASQHWTESNGLQDEHITEKRVNTVPEDKSTLQKIVEQALPNTGIKQAVYLSVIGSMFVGVAIYLKREQLLLCFRRLRRKVKH
jgi:adhesin isopeptide-forming family sspB-C2 type protein